MLTPIFMILPAYVSLPSEDPTFEAYLSASQPQLRTQRLVNAFSIFFQKNYDIVTRMLNTSPVSRQCN